MTSKYSVTQIGAHPDTRSPSSESIHTQFKEESKTLLEYMKTFHHARKLAHMQVNYPNTANELGQQRENRLTQNADKFVPRSVYHDEEERRLNEKVVQISENVASEFDINSRKKHYNKLHARTSMADKIVTGQVPESDKEYIFPQNASHQQILALTHTLSMPDPNVKPPSVPRMTRWMGDGVGWA